MDPYLEGAEWTSFHAELCVEIARQLRPQLRPRYIAQTIKRFVTETVDDLAITAENRNLYPDVGVFKTERHTPAKSASPLAVWDPTFEMATVMPEIVPQYAIEIRDVEERTLVTLIEVLSLGHSQQPHLMLKCFGEPFFE